MFSRHFNEEEQDLWTSVCCPSRWDNWRRCFFFRNDVRS